MKRFRLFWLDKTMEDVEGNDIADAFRRAGYGGGAIRALDYYKEVKDGLVKNETGTVVRSGN
jgi:hypothetical protein